MKRSCCRVGLVAVCVLSLLACTRGGGGVTEEVTPSAEPQPGASGAATPTVTVPQAPQNLVITAQDAQVSLQWGAVADATSYNVYWKTAPGVTIADAKLTSSSPSLVQSGLTNGTAYHYVVTATNTAGEGPASTEVAATPMAVAPGVPQNVTAKAGNGHATLTWDAVTNATSYNVYWSLAPGVTKDTGTKIANASSPYVQAKLQGKVPVYFIVTALGEGGEGSASAEVSVTPDYPLLTMFLTSAKGNGNLHSWVVDSGKPTQWSPTKSGIDAADEICQHLADQAGLNGHYKAWISDQLNDAYCRLFKMTGKKSANCGQAVLPVGAGPWMRTDGIPFSETIAKMLAPTYQVYVPAWYDESGHFLTDFYTYVITDTDPDGVLMGASSCKNWTDAADVTAINMGMVTSVGDMWTAGVSGAHCNETLRLACFETDVGAPLTLTPQSGRKAFVSSVYGTGKLSDWDINGWKPSDDGKVGIAAGDAICQKLAATAGLANAGKFKAWLSDSTITAKERFSDGAWVRLDGFRVADSRADLLDGTIKVPINVNEKKEYLPVQFVWTGTDADGTTNGTTAFCSDWTRGDNDGTLKTKGKTGEYAIAISTWSDAYSGTCDNTYRLYCLED